MVQSLSAQFEKVLTLALQLTPAERIAIIEQLAASFKQKSNADRLSADEAHEFPTDDDIAQLLHVEPLSPAEIEAEGVLGAWADLDIGDSAEWVNEQKRKRSERRQWSMRS